MPAGQADLNEHTDDSESPELQPGLDHSMQDIMSPTLSFFNDIFDLSPSYVEDISWSMRPTAMFEDWNAGERHTKPTRYEAAIGYD